MMKQHKAFTLLEMVFVIVILGIVASIGSTIMAQLFESAIMGRATHRVSIKTELAINQIVNRLTYRIPDSVIARNPTTNAFLNLGDVAANITNRDNIVLEWIGYDNDSFSTTNAPLWSGYCNTNTAVAGAPGRIDSPGSDFNAMRNVVTNLSGANNTPLALLFNLRGDEFNNNINASNAACYGFIDSTCIHQVAIQDATTLTTDNMAAGAGTRITSQYKMAWSAYALIPVDRAGIAIPAGSASVDFDLALAYNYQPWAGETYNNNAQMSIIARNVTAFKFLEQGGTLRIKLCMTEQTGGGAGTNVSVCKEKVVIR